MQDIENVPTDTTSEEGAVLPEVVTPEQEQPKEQPFTEAQEAKILQLTRQAAEAAKESGRREMQGIKDREVAQALQRARFAEDNLASMEEGYRELDPEAAEVTRLKGLERHYQGERQRQQLEQQITANRQVFYENMTQSINEMGVDPYDKRVDWALDAPDPNTAQRRILASIGKIQKENTKAAEAKLTQQLKDIEAKIRKDVGVDSVDTTTSAGVGGLPFQLTNEAIGKLSYEEYKKYEKKIDEAQRKGLIK